MLGPCDPVGGSYRMSTPTEDTQRKRMDAWQKVGRCTALAYSMHADWLFRRVETIEFVGTGSVKRHISVDFEVPPGLPNLRKLAARGTKLVPISVYYKWPPLMGFDFLDPDGKPTSLYRRATNKQLDYGLLLGMVDLVAARSTFDHEPSRKELKKRAKEIADNTVLDPCLQCELKALIDKRSPRWPDVQRTANRLRDELTEKFAGPLNGGRKDIAGQIAATVDLAGRLADSSILWIGVDGEPGTDRIAKFSYNDHYIAKERRPRRWLTACSWRWSNVFISLPHAGRDVIFHLDLQAPHGCVEIADVTVTALPAAGRTHDEAAAALPAADETHDEAAAISVLDLAKKYPQKITKPDRWVGPENTHHYLDYGPPETLARTSQSRSRSKRLLPSSDTEVSSHEASVDLGDGGAHVYLGSESAPSHRVFLQVKLAIRRSGFVANCALTATAIGVLMTFAYYHLASAAENLEPTAVLLSIVPLVLGYVLIRPGEDALEHHHLSGVRFLALVSGALPIIGALTLVLAHTSTPATLAKAVPPHLTTAKTIWKSLMYVSWSLFVLLSGSYAIARGSRRSRLRASLSRVWPQFRRRLR